MISSKDPLVLVKNHATPLIEKKAELELKEYRLSQMKQELDGLQKRAFAWNGIPMRALSNSLVTGGVGALAGGALDYRKTDKSLSKGERALQSLGGAMKGGILGAAAGKGVSAIRDAGLSSKLTGRTLGGELKHMATDVGKKVRYGLTGAGGGGASYSELASRKAVLANMKNKSMSAEALKKSLGAAKLQDQAMADGWKSLPGIIQNTGKNPMDTLRRVGSVVRNNPLLMAPAAIAAGTTAVKEVSDPNAKRDEYGNLTMGAKAKATAKSLGSGAKSLGITTLLGGLAGSPIALKEEAKQIGSALVPRGSKS